MDKNKIIEAAAKLVAKGSYDKAIKEYEKVLAADPKDVRVLQKMGVPYDHETRAAAKRQRVGRIEHLARGDLGSIQDILAEAEGTACQG